MEKFISFQLEELAFKDSLQFMNSSLEKLVENLADKADSKDELEFVFPHLKTYFDKHWSHLPKEAFEMLYIHTVIWIVLVIIHICKKHSH